MAETPFDTSVFINCPFDEHDYPLLRPLLFTVFYSGLQPRIALENLDSGKARLEKIVTLIQESRFAIHDLSRIKSTESEQFFRMNMPFELGLDVGCRLFKGDRWKGKKCLILEADHYRYRAAISDISGSDIAAHNNQPEEVLYVVRNWLTAEAGIRLPGPSNLWGNFNDFMTCNYSDLKNNGYSDRDIERLPVHELMQAMQRWTDMNR
ncbi:MAG: hypothetical protein HGB15_04590 [Chlorobaculum sp.]|nr:hypothetical protein [Chlorobaculum sp.]